MGPYGLEDLNKLLIPLLVLWLVFTVYVVLLLRDFSMNLFKYKTFFSFALGSLNLNIAGYGQDMMGDLKALLKNATAIYIF